MGTDIHLKLWAKPPERDYWSAVEPVFQYGWMLERLYSMERGLGLDFGKPDFPQYQEWAAGAEFADGAYERWQMLRDAAQINHLANSEEFRGVNRYLTALSDRDYDFFAIVGDVRNGTGFAGIETGSRFTPIASGRGTDGLPFDPTDEDNEDKPYYGDHSFSWVTLGELLSYPWEETRRATGVIPLMPDDDGVFSHYTDYATVRATGLPPTGWCGSIDGPGIRTVTPTQADALLDDPTKRGSGIRYYVSYSWRLTSRESINSTTYEAIQWLGQRLDPDTTYLVFGFDS